MYFSGLRYGVYQNAVLYGMSFILSVLTFIYISFAKIFCQNLVKKNCKYVVRIYSKYGGIICGKGHGMSIYDYLKLSLLRFIQPRVFNKSSVIS